MDLLVEKWATVELSGCRIGHTRPNSMHSHSHVVPRCKTNNLKQEFFNRLGHYQNHGVAQSPHAHADASMKLVSLMVLQGQSSRITYRLDLVVEFFSDRQHLASCRRSL
jgi:hypothetical protein